MDCSYEERDDESGLGSLEGPDYFNSYVNNLEMAVLERMGRDRDDPSIDLRQMAVRPPSPIRKPDNAVSIKSNNSAPARLRTDPGLEELEFLANEIKKKSFYSEKLTTIMLKNLEKTLGPETYQVFLKGRLPKTWLPMIKMNNENCPYVEYLIKSDVADQDPESQLSEYTNNHLAYSQFILNHIHSSAQSKFSPEKRLMESTPIKNRNLKRHSKPQQPAISRIQPSPPQQLRIQQQQKSQPDLDTSLRRRQPNRSCKLNSTYSRQSDTK